jgi:hypothetical protein
MMSKLEGAVKTFGLLPHRGLILRLCFYRVPAVGAPAPFEGDPPAEAATDCDEVNNEVDLETESSRDSYELLFLVERQAGHYYLQVRAILLRTHAGKVLAQAEQFFFGSRTVVVPQAAGTRVVLPVPWPAAELDELHPYGTLYPSAREQEE